MTSRRDFLKVAATISMGGIVVNANSTSGKAPKRFQGSFDVLVIGTGGASLSTEHNALDLGLSVAIFEKMGFPEGYFAVCGGQWAVSQISFQKKHGIKDTDELFLKDMLKTGRTLTIQNW